MKKVILQLLLVVAAWAVIGCGDQSQQDAENFKAGMDAYAQGNFAVALEKLRPLAEKGNTDAQERLGLSYAKGSGVERDWVQADKWFSIAAALGKETAVNNKKVVEVHMQPEKIAEANALAQEWLAKHKK